MIARRLLIAATLLLPAAGVAVAQGSWTTAAPMPLARSELNAVAVDGRLYVAGGIAQLGTSPAFQVYDPIADGWRSLAPLPQPRHHFGLAALDGRIYLAGGFDTLPFGADQARRETWIYDIAANAWSRAADLPAGRAAHAMVAAGERLYVIGGVGAEPAGLYAYDPKLDIWKRLSTALPTPREHLTAAAVAGEIHVIGGRWSGRGNLATVESYDPTANSWSTRADMPTARGGLTAAVLDGRIHVTGGEDLGSGETFRAHEVYDPATGRWSARPPLPTARHGLASGVIDGRWYVVGGGEGAGAMTFVTLSDRLEVFEP